MVRKCRSCKEEKDLETGFYCTGKGRFAYICKQCTRERSKEHGKKVYVKKKTGFNKLPESEQRGIVKMLNDGVNANKVALKFRINYATLKYWINNDQIPDSIEESEDEESEAYEEPEESESELEEEEEESDDEEDPYDGLQESDFDEESTTAEKPVIEETVEVDCENCARLADMIISLREYIKHLRGEDTN